MDRSAVYFHHMLHVFREGRGTGTASLKVKLLQQLTAMREEVIYKVSLASENPMTPWTGIVSWRSWWGTALDNRWRGFSAYAETTSLWWPGQGDVRVPLSKTCMESPRETLYPPPFSTWWWIPWYGTGWRYLQGRRPTQKVSDEPSSGLQHFLRKWRALGFTTNGPSLGGTGCADGNLW